MRELCDCDGPPCLVVDHVTCDEICARCGVVVDRVLCDDGYGGFYDCAGPPGAALGTRLGVGRVPGVSERVMAAAGACDSLEVHRRELREACARARISVPSAIHTTAEKMFEDYVAARDPGGRSRRVAAAACLYFACRMERADRELRTVAATCDVQPAALNAAVKAVKDYLLTTEPYATAMRSMFGGVDSLVGVYIDRLGLDVPTRKRLWRETHRVLDASDMGNSGKKPRTIAATAIHAAAAALDLGIHKKDIAAAAGVCAQTLVARPPVQSVQSVQSVTRP